MNENTIGAIVVDYAVEPHRDWGPGRLETVDEVTFGEASMRDGITRVDHGNLDPDPPCLGASVREEFIEQWTERATARRSAVTFGPQALGTMIDYRELPRKKGQSD